MMEQTNNQIRVYSDGELIAEYEGNIFIYRDDYKKEGCVHFKDEYGKHHRIYSGVVLINEQ